MKYSSQGKQLILNLFSGSLEESLDRENRWCKLANSLPWDKIECVYNSTLNNVHNGGGNKPARMIVGALIIKHQMNLSDRETIDLIQENPYMQYFVGLHEFSNFPIFDASLFVHIRKRLGINDINDITCLLMKALEDKPRPVEDGEEEGEDNNLPGKKEGQEDAPKQEEEESFVDESGVLHSGKLIVDASCCDAEVKYPTDLDVLHDAVKVSDRLIEKLCKITGTPLPRSFLKTARANFLGIVKKRRKGKREIRKGISLQLHYLFKHIGSIADIVAKNNTSCLKKLKKRERQFIGTIIKVYYQQKEMFDKKAHQCKDRIISVFQPHIRPIVRGKSKAKVEFGSKIGVAVVKGYTFIDHHSWDAYNESEDLKVHLDNYLKRFGCLPVKCYADKIYLNRKKRNLLKDNHIQAAGKPLGRPSKEMLTEEYKQQAYKDNGIRNGVEATFGTGKRVYRANDIRAKLPDTGDTWTAMCFLVKNVKRFLKEFLFALFYWLINYRKNNAYRMNVLEQTPHQNIGLLKMAGN